MKTEISAWLWPVERIGEALETLARVADLPLAAGPMLGPLPPEVHADHATLTRWIDTVARSRRLEIDPLTPTYRTMATDLSSAAPAILTLGSGLASAPCPPTGLLVFVASRAGRARLLSPEGNLEWVRVSDLVEALRAGVVPTTEQAIDALLRSSGVDGDDVQLARSAILVAQLGAKRIEAGYCLRLPAGAPFTAQLRKAGLVRRMLAVVVLEGTLQFFGLTAWWLVGRATLDGALERGWLLAWVLLLITTVPLRVVTSWLEGSGATEFAVLFRRRLLRGILALETEETRGEGSGQVLSRVLESEAFETLVTTGSLGAVLACVETISASLVLGLGMGATGVLMLLAYLVACIGCIVLYGRRIRAWTTGRRSLTNAMVEGMIGYRTRLAHESMATWHDEEDGALGRYVGVSSALDHASIVIGALPFLWLVIGVAALTPEFARSAVPMGVVAVSLGGIMLAHRAIARFSACTPSLLAAYASWSQAALLFDAAGRTETVGRAALLPSPPEGVPNGPIVEAKRLSFRHRDRPRYVLEEISLRIERGDRILLEGPSGGGKSTLTSVLSGLRAPTEGLLLQHGFDRQALGPTAWRQRVVAAPQFHENHVLSATFAFNLLMGRAWPPSDDDLQEAEEVCRDLGLGVLLDRMPAGLRQMVGDTGWQLSHGEKSRLFIARALLQRAELIILDESFAALDPETLDRAVRCVFERASSLLVVAHP